MAIVYLDRPAALGFFHHDLQQDARIAELDKNKSTITSLTSVYQEKFTVAKTLVAVTDFGAEDINVEKAILEPLGCEVIGPLRGTNAKDEKQLIDLVKDADHVITQFSPVTAAVIDSMQKSKIIVRYGIGVDNVDLKAAAAKNIPVCNVPDYCIDEVADSALAMILDLARKITAHAALIRKGKWALAVPVSELYVVSEMTVGVVGFGRIGREVANRLKPFRCKILVSDPVVDAASVKAQGCIPVSFEELLHSSDLVTLHCPSNEHTKQMINAQTLGKMKKGAMLVNTSRGTLVKTDDLIAALQSGQISSAALDVTDPEPINPDNPLVLMDNVIINPHLASASPGAVTKLRTGVANIVALAVKGEKLPNIVNGVKA
jgi:D-3-phosphoglycerate dehydrogenase / 2-oxoglutarate reductase